MLRLSSCFYLFLKIQCSMMSGAKEPIFALNETKFRNCDSFHEVDGYSWWSGPELSRENIE